MRDISSIDVTRSRAEAALRRSEERYRAVSELTSDYVYEYSVAANGQLTLEEVTAAFTRITGFSPEESRSGAVGKLMSSLETTRWRGGGCSACSRGKKT